MGFEMELLSVFTVYLKSVVSGGMVIVVWGIIKNEWP